MEEWTRDYFSSAKERLYPSLAILSESEDRLFDQTQSNADGQLKHSLCPPPPLQTKPARSSVVAAHPQDLEPPPKKPFQTLCSKELEHLKIPRNTETATKWVLDNFCGAQTVVHPGAQILAEGGPIVIGEGNLIQEQVTIINKKLEDEEQKTLVIGNGNVFHVGAYCESYSVGNKNTFESKSLVGRGVTISDGCVIGAACEVISSEKMPPDTIIYGSDCRRYTKSTPPQTNMQQQVEYLIKVLPNYHHLIKSSS